jgi:tetratricopeptide (TPR) repeat protein
MRSRADKFEAIYAKDPNNYLAKRELAVIYSWFYLHYIQAGSSSASAYREKALTLTHEALEKAPLPDRADLGMCLENLGYDQEALSVYEKFLEDVQHTPPPIPSFASNAPPVLQRAAEANWSGLIATVQARADMLKKAAATNQPAKQ